MSVGASTHPYRDTSPHGVKLLPQASYYGRTGTRPEPGGPAYRSDVGQRVLERQPNGFDLERFDHEITFAELHALDHLRLLPHGGAHDDARARIEGEHL